MDLEELQLAWTQMGEELETQKKLTKEIIMEMTRARYKKTSLKKSVLMKRWVQLFVLEQPYIS